MLLESGAYNSDRMYSVSIDSIITSSEAILSSLPNVPIKTVCREILNLNCRELELQCEYLGNAIHKPTIIEQKT